MKIFPRVYTIIQNILSTLYLNGEKSKAKHGLIDWIVFYVISAIFQLYCKRNLFSTIICKPWIFCYMYLAWIWCGGRLKSTLTAVINANLSMYSIWHSDTTAKGTKKKTSPNIISLQYNGTKHGEEWQWLTLPQGYSFADISIIMTLRMWYLFKMFRYGNFCFMARNVFFFIQAPRKDILLPS